MNCAETSIDFLIEMTLKMFESDISASWRSLGIKKKEKI
jgi:hypothetical protein